MARSILKGIARIMQNIPWQLYFQVIVYVDYTIAIRFGGGRKFILKPYQWGKQRPKFQDFYQKEYLIIFISKLKHEKKKKTSFEVIKNEG